MEDIIKSAASCQFRCLSISSPDKMTDVYKRQVEDNDLNRKIVSQMLLNFGFQVREAINGLECLKILQDHHFDLILMDMQMPIMDGYEATRFIRDMESQKSIRCV